MIVGVLKLEVFIGGASSLKDKRRVVRRVCDRVRARHNVAIAEVGECDLWQRSTLGVACVSNEMKLVESVLSSVLRDVEMETDLEVTRCERTIV
ncbi:MAG: DUF503 domain-containing protein [Firmicutes bacterium]|jgi:uncharacterized protein YlxP (DUF503 family)|nr:DUF503 domain-containing protein [Bacillota bacterium]MDH7495506.1 DUF503 domain-containing protein [Bacillota bacterium]